MSALSIDRIKEAIFSSHDSIEHVASALESAKVFEEQLRGDSGPRSDVRNRPRRRQPRLFLKVRQYLARVPRPVFRVVVDARRETLERARFMRDR